MLRCWFCPSIRFSVPTVSKLSSCAPDFHSFSCIFQLRHIIINKVTKSFMPGFNITASRTCIIRFIIYSLSYTHFMSNLVLFLVDQLIKFLLKVDWSAFDRHCFEREKRPVDMMEYRALVFSVSCFFHSLSFSISNLHLCAGTLTKIAPLSQFFMFFMFTGTCSGLVSLLATVVAGYRHSFLLSSFHSICRATCRHCIVITQGFIKILGTLATSQFVLISLNIIFLSAWCGWKTV